MKNEPCTFTALKMRQFIHSSLDYPRFSLCDQVQKGGNKIMLITGYPGGGRGSYYADKHHYTVLNQLSSKKD